MTVTLPDMVEYLGADVAENYGDSTVSEVLAEETAAQLLKVTFPTTVNEDGDTVALATPTLDAALKRRVLVALSKRNLPYGILETGDGSTATRVSSADAEYKRLEAPYRRWKGAVG